MTGFNRFVAAPLLRLTDAIAALLLAADLLVVAGSVLSRTMLDAPWTWADDVARGLMVALSFFGAAGALARGDNVGVAFFVDKFPPRARRLADALNAVLVLVITGNIAFYALQLGQFTTGQTTGSGLPLELTFYPMGVGAVFMALFALFQLGRHAVKDIALAIVAVAVAAGIWFAWTAFAPDSTPAPGPLMLLGFVVCLVGGVPIGFALALSALIYLWVSGTLPGVIFAQQMARGIDNFVLLAIPFFILVGYLMEANGMSVRLIELLERLVGRMRGGLNVVMVLAMVIFSGISGSKMADVAAVGSVLIPAARRSRQNPGEAVALLAASAVMAETIPPCINLIILGFVANLSIGGLFMAGLLPAGLMALALIAVAVIFGKRAALAGRGCRAAHLPGQAMGRRRRHAGSDRHHLRRLSFRIRHGDRDLRLRRAVRAGGRRRGVPRTRAARRAAQFRQCRDAVGAGAVHRRRGAVAGVHADLATGAAYAGARR